MKLLKAEEKGKMYQVSEENSIYSMLYWCLPSQAEEVGNGQGRIKPINKLIKERNYQVCECSVN